MFNFYPKMSNISQFVIWNICRITRFFPSKHSSWWRRLEDVFRFRLQKTSSRRLQDVLIKTNMFALALRLQDVFKTSWSRPIYLSWLYVFKTSSRRFQDVFKTFRRRLQNVFKTSSRRLQDLLEDVKLLRWRPVDDVFKTCLEDVLKTFSRPTNVCWVVIFITKLCMHVSIVLFADQWNYFDKDSFPAIPLFYSVPSEILTNCYW